MDGVALATPGLTATGTTAADGTSSIVITSTVTGQTKTTAVASYVGNPYPNLLFEQRELQRATATRSTGKLQRPGYPDQDVDSSHLPVSTSPLTMASTKDNTGEDELVTLTLVDVYGNAIPGYQVEWTLQGVGVLKNAQTGD